MIRKLVATVVFRRVSFVCVFSFLPKCISMIPVSKTNSAGVNIQYGVVQNVKMTLTVCANQ